MEVRECKIDDVISLLQCAKEDDDIDFIDNWEQYQKWLLDAVYNKNWQVIVAVDNSRVLGFIVWNLYQECWKWVGRLNYIYVAKDQRKKEISDRLVLEYIPKIWNSSAQRLEFSSKVLPTEWVDAVALNVPHDKYMTYHFTRTDELREWYNANFQRT